MVKSLYTKLAIVLLVLFCLLGVTILIVTQFASDMYQQEFVQKLNRNLAKQIVAQKILMEDNRISEKGLKDVFDMLMVVNVYSPDDSLSPEFISNYASINVADVLARINGVAEARNIGALDYGMRIWLDPDRMAALSLTTDDVVTAIREQNVQVAVGQVPVDVAQQLV